MPRTDEEIVRHVATRYHELRTEGHKVDFKNLVQEGVTGAGYTHPVAISEAMSRVTKIFNERRANRRQAKKLFY